MCNWFRVPRFKRTKKFYKKYNGEPDYNNYDVCVEAVANQGNLITLVPKENITAELLDIALHNGFAYIFMYDRDFMKFFRKYKKELIYIDTGNMGHLEE